MTDTTKALLEKLAEIAPERFECNKDEEYGGEMWTFSDDHLSITVDVDRPVYRWLLTIMDTIPVGCIWKQNDRTWQESILNMVVHWFEMNQPQPEVKPNQ